MLINLPSHDLMTLLIFLNIRGEGFFEVGPQKQGTCPLAACGTEDNRQMT